MKLKNPVVWSAILLILAAQPAYAMAPASAASPIKTMTAQAAYVCQGKADGFPPDEDTMSIQVQLNVPTSVAPGESVSLRGSMKIQFSENLRQKTKLVHVDTIDVFSTSISTYRTLGSQAGPYLADRWQTGPTPVRNPVEVSGPLSFPAFKVPANASGSIKLQLPQNGSTKNLASSSPADVAFNANVHAYGPVASIKVIMSCFLPRATPGVIATIPISAQSTGGGSGSGSDTGVGAAAPSAGAPITGQPATGGTGGSTGAAAAPPAGAPITGQPVIGGTGGSTGAPAPGSPAGSAGVVTPADSGQAVAGGQPQETVNGQPYASVVGPADDPDGVYVSSSLLVLGGFLFCMLTLGYATLTNYRIRSMRKALND